MSKDYREEFKKELNYHEDIVIDSDKLDEQVETQPSIYVDYSILAGDKRDEVTEQKKVLKVKDAELKRESATLYIEYKREKVDGKNPTDTYVSSQIEIDTSYIKKYDETIKALEKYNKLIYQLDILDSVVTGFQQRKNMLEERIKLFQNGYHSEVKQNKYSDKMHDKLNKDK